MTDTERIEWPMSTTAIKQAARKLACPDPELLRAAKKPGRPEYDLHLAIKLCKRAQQPNPSAQNQSDFAQAFASLALTSMQNNPRFLENMIGFQLLEKDEEDGRAVGVFAAQINGLMFYVLAIFTNGRIEGTDMMYCREVGAVVPNQEKWINTLVNRGVQDVGIAQDISQPALYAPDSPDYGALVRPLNKFGSALDWRGALSRSRAVRQLQEARQKVAALAPAHWSAPFREDYDVLLELLQRNPWEQTKQADWEARLQLPRWLERSPRACQTVFAWSQRYPLLYKAAQRLYGEDFLVRGLQHWDEVFRLQTMPRLKRAEDKSSSSYVRIVSITASGVDDLPSLLEGLPTEAKERAVLQGYIVDDRRSADQVSVLVDEGEALRRLENPSEYGVYDVLTPSGRLIEAAVLTNLLYPFSKQTYCAVAPLDTRWNAVSLVPLAGVWAVAETDQRRPKRRWQRWFEDLPSVTALYRLNRSRGILLVGENGETLGPFLLLEKFGPSSFSIQLDDVAFSADRVLGEDCHCTTEPHDSGPPPRMRRLRLVLKNIGQGRPRWESSHSHLLISGNFRVIYSDWDEPSHEYVFGATPAVLAQQWCLTGTQPIKLASADGRTFVADQLPREWPRTKRAWSRVEALQWLLEVVGLREAEAQQLLDKAAARGSCTFRVRPAQGYPDLVKHAQMIQPQGLVGTMPIPANPGEMLQYSGGPLPYQEAYAAPQQLPVPYATPPQEIFDMHALSQPQLIGPDPATLQIAQQAGQMGMNDVLQTAFASAIMQQRDIASLMQEDLPYFFMALDRLGRHRLRLAYRPEVYRERYGDSDLPVLKDMLASLFKQFADLILMLKEKDVSPLPSLDVAEVSPSPGGNYRF